MNPRKLNILIIVLYVVAAFCMLGVGSVREQLREGRAAAQIETVGEVEEPQAEAVGDEDERIQELEMKLTIWQVVTIIIFAMASLLLIFKEKLIKKIPPQAK